MKYKVLIRTTFLRCIYLLIGYVYVCMDEDVGWGGVLPSCMPMYGILVYAALTRFPFQFHLNITRLNITPS